MRRSIRSPRRGLNRDRVCIIKPSSLGDIVHAMPILSALRARWPSAHLAWVVNRPFAELLEGHPDLDELIVYNRGRRGLDRDKFLGMAALLARLRRSRFDLTIDLQGLLRSALMVAATGAADPRRHGRCPRGRPLVLHPSRRRAPAGHARGRSGPARRPLRSAPTTPRREFNLPIPGDARRWAAETVAGLPRPRVILNVGARWLTKRWPPAHFAAIGRRAVEQFGGGLIAVGSSADRPLVDALLGHLAPIPVLDLCGRTRLPQLAALSLESDLVISNDTGPLHLAAAAGARVVGIYTCTSPELTGPYRTPESPRSSLRLVRGQLPQVLRPPRLHDRASAGQRLAGGLAPARSRRGAHRLKRRTRGGKRGPEIAGRSRLLQRPDFV